MISGVRAIDFQRNVSDEMSSRTNIAPQSLSVKLCALKYELVILQHSPTAVLLLADSPLGLHSLYNKIK